MSLQRLHTLISRHLYPVQLRLNSRHSQQFTASRLLSQSALRQKRHSYLTESDLEATIESLKEVKASLPKKKPRAAKSQNKGSPEMLLDEILDMMQLRLNARKAITFSGLKHRDLDHLNIKKSGSLRLKSDYETRARAFDALGTDEHWSSHGLYRHLKFLQSFIHESGEAAARTWIDALFFRAAASLPPGKKLLLGTEQSVLATHFDIRMEGFIDYALIMVDEQDAKSFLNPDISILEHLLKHRESRGSVIHATLFVSEAKSLGANLHHHIPQVVCEMYSCAKMCGQNVIRGVLTNGYEWIFIIVKLNCDGGGGVYTTSGSISLTPMPIPGSEELSYTMCTVVPGILVHWIKHSGDNIQDDDWFVGNQG